MVYLFLHFWYTVVMANEFLCCYVFCVEMVYGIVRVWWQDSTKENK